MGVNWSTLIRLIHAHTIRPTTTTMGRFCLVRYCFIINSRNS